MQKIEPEASASINPSPLSYTCPVHCLKGKIGCKHTQIFMAVSFSNPYSKHAPSSETKR